MAKVAIVGAGMMGSALCVPLAARLHDGRPSASPAGVRVRAARLEVLDGLELGTLGGLASHDLPLLIHRIELGLHAARPAMLLSEFFPA